MSRPSVFCLFGIGSSIGWRDGVGLLAALAWVTGLALAVPCDAKAQQDGAMLSIAETEQLVRVRYYEGMPTEEARRIGDAGCARLVEMLADPSEAEHHAQILLAIGICAPQDGYEAIAAWADRPREGEIDRATFRAWQALPFALGHLAEHDARAVERLADDLEEGMAPRWSFRHHRGGRLLELSRRAAASCLAETGLPAARRALERAGRRASDADFAAHLAEARARHAERAARRAGESDR